MPDYTAAIEPHSNTFSRSLLICGTANWTIDESASATQRFVDLTGAIGHGPKRRLSLKSTAAKNLSETTAHISKLTEAAWIQDARMPRDRRERVRTLFREYRQAVDAIMMLRAFRKEGVPHRYQLLEIPTRPFVPAQEAPLTVFHSDARSISCEIDGQLAAVIAIDRSDAEITVKRIRLSATEPKLALFSTQYISGRGRAVPEPASGVP